MLETLSEQRCFGGVQSICRHQSAATGTPMRFAVFVPPGEGPFPVLWFLAGLTCTEENFVTKAGAQRAAAEYGLILIAPDTSPRGDVVPDDETYDFGKGAGFYVDATEAPWSANYRMRSYIENELPALISASFPADMGRQGITGHSMGGHGALTVALRNPASFRSVSAFAPIVSPVNCPWGEKALTGYLGRDRAAWRAYDACALIEDGARAPEILVDQGDADQFLTEQLKPQLLAEACQAAGIDLTLRMQPGYDHSYYFIASFIADHIFWHAARLR
jgi:S-formylglutathione hydrolase